MNIVDQLRKSNWIIFDKIKNLNYSEEEKQSILKQNTRLFLKKKNNFIKLEEPKCLLNKNKSKSDIKIIDKYNQDIKYLNSLIDYNNEK